MAKIRYILLKNPVVVPTGTKLIEAAQLMKKTKVASVLVSKNGMLAGIVSMEDIVLRVAERADIDIAVDEMMQSPDLTIDSEKWLSDAVTMFERHKASHITVVEHGEKVGIIRADDILHTYRFNKEGSYGLEALPKICIQRLKLRRKDKEIEDTREIESIISRSDVCRIALSENNSPYIIPMCFGYRDNCLYFHSAANGKKIDIIKKNNRVCFEFDTHEGLIKSENACDWDMKYQSVAGSGKAFFIEDPEEKTKALNIIVGHYSSDAHEYQKNSVDNVIIIKVEIEKITGKKSGYL